MAPDTPPNDPGPEREPPSYDADKEDYVGVSSGSIEGIEGLRDARAFAEMVVDTVREGLLILDLDLRVVAANESFYRTFGVKPEETVGRLVYDLGDGQWDIPKLRELLEDILPHKKAFDDYEVDHEFEGLGRRCVVLNGRWLNDHRLVLLALEDVTERRADERERRESGERYRVLVESAREYAILMLDPGGRITTWSAGAERVFGYTEDEAVGEPAAMIYTEEDQAAGVPARELELAREEGSAVDERWYRRKGGGQFWASGVLEAFPDDDGRPLGYTKVLRDNTVRKRAGDALRASEARFREMAETVPDALFTATPDGRVDYVSGQIEAFTGARPEDVVGTGLWPDLVHPDDRARVRAEWVGAVRDRRQFEARHRLRHTGDGYRWVVVRARPVYDEEGRLARWFGTVSDVDALARSEGEVRELNRTLEGRVKKRTVQVRELARALTLAEQAERKRIAYLLHDDLQQRLYGLGITLSLLGRHGEGGEAERLRAQAVETLDRASALTRTLSHELSPALLEGDDLSDLLEWVAGRKREALGLDVAVEVRGQVSVPEEEVRVLLYQIVRELLFNVAKHAGTKRARITAEEDGDEVRVTVEDEGGGFDVAVLDEATGLGLLSVRERLALVGGRLAVESAPGAGTRVTVVVPLGDAGGE